MAQAFIELLREKSPEAVVSSHTDKGGDDVVTVKREHLVEAMTFLRNHAATDLKLLRQIAAVDLLTYQGEMTGGGALASNEVPSYEAQKKRPVEPRYQVAYNLYSVTQKKSLRVRVELRGGDVKVPTLTGLWRTADWWERYCFDMMGIEFVGHPNLKRLML